MIRIMSADAFARLLPLCGPARAFPRGTLLFACGDRVRRLHLVESGEVRLQRDATGGARLVLQRARAGAVLAEASLRAARYHCDAEAATDARVRSVPLARALAALGEDRALADAWATALALELQATRARAALLRLRGVAERLDAWLALTGGPVPPRGERLALADEIGVTPAALYRELARRRAR